MLAISPDDMRKILSATLALSPERIVPDDRIWVRDIGETIQKRGQTDPLVAALADLLAKAREHVGMRSAH